MGTKSMRGKLWGDEIAYELARQIDHQFVQFVFIELDMAVTFCERALSTNDPTTRARNIENALKGYQTALRFSKTWKRELVTEVAFQQKSREVKSLLHQLGRDV